GRGGLPQGLVRGAGPGQPARRHDRRREAGGTGARPLRRSRRQDTGDGARDVQVRAPGEGVLDDLVGKMDRVVIDAPCTGSGTWRRRPDAKWKLNTEQVAARAAEQHAILSDGARYVCPGGTL